MYGRASAVLIVSAGIALGLSACGAGAPELRSPDGQFAPCAAKRCVSSRAGETGYAVRPITYTGSRDAARAALQRLIAEMPGAEVVEQREDYLHATFTSTVMRYVDDLELDFPAHERVVHVRSSSRIGYYDFNANRDRVESLRARFEALQP